MNGFYKLKQMVILFRGEGGAISIGVGNDKLRDKIIL